MKAIVGIIIGLIVYFGGGWIGKDIVFSMVEITGDMTLKDVSYYECATYSIIAFAFCVIFTLITARDDNDDRASKPISLLVVSFLLVTFFPISLGMGILYNILNVVAIIWVSILAER